MTTPVNPAISSASTNRSGAEPSDGGSAFADHLDFMFGNGTRKYPTGPHVEVLRMSGSSASRYFRKQFLAVEAEGGRTDYGPWTEREHVLVMNLSHSNVPHVQAFRAMVRGEYFETEDAGPDLKHWLDLPVTRAGLELDHVVFDCANWFSLARWSLQALRGVNNLGFVHLDLKADNLCLPSKMPFDAGSGLVLPDWPRLCLIDFAFSVWEQRLPLDERTPLIIGKEESNRYQSRQLLNAIQIVQDSGFKDMSAARKLDWRADLYSLGYLLAGILDHLPAALRAGKAGWTEGRLQAAQGIAATLQDFDENWLNNSERPSRLPHDDLITRVNLQLRAHDLQQSLADPWKIVNRPGWKPGAAGQFTPVTRVAHNLRGKSEARPRQPQRLWRVGGIAALATLAGFGYLAWQPSPPPTLRPDVVKPELSPADFEAPKHAATPRSDVVKPELSPADFETQKQAALKEKAAAAKAEVDAETDRKAKLEAIRLAEAKKVEVEAAKKAALKEEEEKVKAIRAAEKAEAARKAQAEAARQAAEREARLKKRKQAFDQGAALLADRSTRGNSQRAGEWYSAALQDVTGQTLSNTDRQMTNDILRAVDAVALVGGDRAFAAAILPGLTHVATLGDAPSARLLANILICRVSPPRLEDAKRFLNIAAQNPVWKETALARLKTIDNTELCETFSKPKPD